MAGARIPAIDCLRGLIMALMALDHTRDFVLGFSPDPTDLATTTPALFATRWITHLCAPGFLLLAGMAIRLQGEAMPRARLAVRLMLRGLLLVVLEMTLVTFAWIPDPSRSLILWQVIWAIGWSMVAMAGLIWLPAAVVAALGVAICAFHPHLSALLALADAPGWLRMVLIDANGALDLGRTRAIVSYPVLPWLGVMAAGYGLGGVLGREGWAAPVSWLGLGLLALFVALRLGGLGDPVPWTAEAGRPVLAFLDAEKYPPSPVFLAMTLGPLLLMLAALQRFGAGQAAAVLRPLGQAPLFFYVLHLYALRAFGLAAAAIVWGPENLGPPPLHSTPEWPLPAVWAVWLMAMAALLPPTRWFARLRQRRRGGWTAYV